MTSMKIVDYTPEFTEDLLRLINQISHPPMTREALAELEASSKPQPGDVRVIGREGDEVVAAGILHARPNNLPGWMTFDVIVDTAARGRGIGSAMRERLEEGVASVKPKGLEGRVKDDDPLSLRWAESMGFKEWAHRFENVLDLAKVDGNALAGAVEKAEAAEIRFFDFTDKQKKDWDRLYQLVSDLLLMAPDSQGLNPPPREFFDNVFYKGTSTPLDALVVAADGDEWVGVTISQKRGDHLYTWFTGTHPKVRGRGIAKALKVHTIRWAVAHGYSFMSTHNLSVNAPMLAVNESLGYERKPGFFLLRKPLT